MLDFKFIDSSFIEDSTFFPHLVDVLKEAFGNSEMIVPLRHHHDFPNPNQETDSTMLLMPAWDPGKNGGVKIVCVSPHNTLTNLPTIQGSYLFFDSLTGSIKAILEAKTLTNKRTAAASALASQFLSNETSSSLLMIGTGSLAPDLIRAHCSVRPIKEVWLYGRSFEKAQTISAKLTKEGINITPVDSLEAYIPKADIISCATISETPLFSGKLLRPGQHIDLVGSYKKNMREADDETILRSEIFLDNYTGGLKETGDIVIPIETGILKKESIKADLFELCSGTKPGRQTTEAITLFKSVGHALEDLAAAEYYYNKYQK
jgi:ornithine cyclodeaminase